MTNLFCLWDTWEMGSCISIVQGLERCSFAGFAGASGSASAQPSSVCRGGLRFLLQVPLHGTDQDLRLLPSLRASDPRGKQRGSFANTIIPLM